MSVHLAGDRLRVASWWPVPAHRRTSRGPRTVRFTVYFGGGVCVGQAPTYHEAHQLILDRIVNMKKRDGYALRPGEYDVVDNWDTE